MGITWAKSSVYNLHIYYWGTASYVPKIMLVNILTVSSLEMKESLILIENVLIPPELWGDLD